MRQLDREGVFKAVPVQWGIQRSQASQSVALVIDLKITAQHNGTDWDDWSGYEDHSIVGWFYIIKRDGAINQATVDNLVASIGWDGNIAGILNDPPAVTCQVTVASEEYNGKSRLKVKWINPEDYTPGAIGGESAADVAAIASQFGSLLRAAAASSRAKMPVHETKTPPPVAKTAVETQMAPAAPLDGPPAPPPLTDDDLPF